jgi:hypothetical protein
MHPCHHILTGNVAQHKRQVLKAVDKAGEHVPLEGANAGRHGR